MPGGMLYRLLTEEEERSCVCVLYASFFVEVFRLTPPASFSGVDVQEAENCFTEATTPTSFEPTGQSQMSTVELDESVPEEVTPTQGEVSPADEDTSPAEEVTSPEEEASPTEAEAGLAQPKEDSERRRAPEGNTDSNSQSVDELLADWREDLEAFQQMEKDEL